MARRPLLLAVDGRSGAGKTSLALELAALLRPHLDVEVFHLDSVYPGWDGLDAALDTYAAAHPGTPTRHEDHVGHKVEWQNDIALERTLNGRRVKLGVTCDWLTKVHQGSHSADAFGNDVHELLYAVRCSDGTKIVADLLARFGPVNRFTQGTVSSRVV